MEVFGELKAGVRLRRPLNASDLFERARSGRAVTLLRRGARLFLGGDAEGVGQYFDPNEFLGPEEVLFDSSGGEIDTGIEHEEIELNNFETVETPLEGSVATETTPLLGGGAALSTGTSTAATAGTGILITGVAAGIGGAVVHYTSHRGEPKDEGHREEPVLTLPNHRYLGPGNTADTDTSLPIDEDDRIAQQHDIDYSKVKTPSDVHNADDIAIGRFAKDFLETGNPHSALGAIGLGFKRGGETLVGVQYPPISSTGKMGRKYNPYADPTERREWLGYENQSEQSLRNRRRYIWNAWNINRQSQGLIRVDPPLEAGIEVTMRPRIEGGVRPSSESIPYTAWKDKIAMQKGPLLDALGNQQESPLSPIPDLDLNDLEDPDVVDYVMQDLQPDSSSNGQSSSNSDIHVPETQDPEPEPGPSRHAIIPASDESMDSGEARPAKRPRPSPAAAVANDGSGHQSGSDGGFDSAQGPVKFLGKGGYQVNSGQMTFQKVHRMKTWALPYKTLATTDRGGAKLTVTPLAKVPWEYMFMYCSPEDFQLIPAGSYVHSAHVEITQLVASTAFPTGGVESSTATANHPKIACIGIDLEKKMRGGIDKSVQIDENMIPIAATNSAQSMFDNFIKFQYGTDQTVEDQVAPGVAFGIPFYNNCHYCIYNPNVAQATQRGFTAETAPGYEYFKNCIQEYNANDTTYSKVLGMSYKFENAPIGQQFPPLEIYTTNFVQSTGNARYYNAQRTVTGNNIGGDTTLTESYVPSNKESLPIVTYSSSMIEKGAHFTRGDAPGKPSRQPSIHIGMRAIDKNDPAVGFFRAEQFVQAVLDFEIKCTLTVNLPSYPNRFVRAKFYNTSIENFVGGIGRYEIPAQSSARVVSFGLGNDDENAPAVAEVDQVGDEPTESGLSIPGRKQRPRRALPHVPKAKENVRRPAPPPAAPPAETSRN